MKPSERSDIVDLVFFTFVGFGTVHYGFPPTEWKFYAFVFGAYLVRRSFDQWI